MYDPHGEIKTNQYPVGNFFSKLQNTCEWDAQIHINMNNFQRACVYTVIGPSAISALKCFGCYHQA